MYTNVYRYNFTTRARFISNLVKKYRAKIHRKVR